VEGGKECKIQLGISERLKLDGERWEGEKVERVEGRETGK